MFTGHFAVALAAAGSRPRLPLGLLLASAFAGDLIEGAVAAFNVTDPSRAWSHSLPATAGAGLVIGLVWRIRGGSWSEAAIIAMVALSHTALDFITGYKTYWPGLPAAGFRLYEQPAVEYALELLAIATGWTLWRRAVPRERRRSDAVWLMLALLTGAQTLVFIGMLLFGASQTPDAMSKFVR